MVFTAILPALLCPIQDGKPLELDTRIFDSSMYSVKLTLDGKEGRFAIGLNSTRTTIDPSFLTESEPGTVTVVAGVFKLGDVRPLVAKSPTKEVQGVLGRDVLNGFALGFDVEAGQVVLWPKSPALKSLADWVGPGAKEAKLSDRAGTPCIEGKDPAGRPFYFGVTAWSAYPTISPAFADQFGFIPRAESKPAGGLEGEVGVAGPIVAANRVWPWFTVLRTPHSPGPDVAGVFNVIDFHGNRMVVDLAGSRIVHVPVNGREAVVSMLERVLNVRLDLREGKVFLRRRDAPGYDLVTDAELLEFSGKSTAEWLTKLDRSGPLPYELLKSLHNEASTGLIKLRLTDGRIMTVEIARG